MGAAARRASSRPSPARRDVRAASTRPSRRSSLLGLPSAAAAAASAAAHLLSPAPSRAEIGEYVLGGAGGEGIVDVDLQLGDSGNHLVFVPDRLELKQGVLYRLRLRNAGAVSHNFAAPGFVDRSFSILVRTGQGAGGTDALVEVKGPGIRTVGMKAGGAADWYLMPVRTGDYELQCTVPGHEAMRGVITVVPGPS